MKLLTFAITEEGPGFDLDKHIKEVISSCGVPLACPCAECGSSVSVNETLALLAQRILDLEARVTALE
jgi:hypothetical protein